MLPLPPLPRRKTCLLTTKYTLFFIFRFFPAFLFFDNNCDRNRTRRSLDSNGKICVPLPSPRAHKAGETRTVYGKKQHTGKHRPVLEMSCAVCAANVENTTRALPGVLQADVNFASNDMHLVYDRSVISLEEIQRQIRAIGYDNPHRRRQYRRKKRGKTSRTLPPDRLRTLGAGPWPSR